MEEERDRAQKEARAKTQVNEQLQTSQKILRGKLKVAQGASNVATEDAMTLVDLKTVLESEQRARRAQEAEIARLKQ